MPKDKKKMPDYACPECGLRIDDEERALFDGLCEDCYGDKFSGDDLVIEDDDDD